MSIEPNAWVARARAAVGTSLLPQGMCLGHQFAWSGISSSIGPGQGHYGTAMDGWKYAVKKHAGETNPPVGVPVYFGISPTRTDANKAAGDVCVSIGNGQVIATDAVGSKVGIMTISARAAQTRRPYLGWCGDFLGWDVIYASTTAPASTTITPIKTVTTATTEPEEEDMPVVKLVSTPIPAARGGKGFDYWKVNFDSSEAVHLNQTQWDIFSGIGNYQKLENQSPALIESFVQIRGAGATL